MGAWGYEPFDSDYAMEWIENDINIPLLTSIQRKMTTFIQDGFTDDVEKHQAVAAVALLVQMCQVPGITSESTCPINLYYQAKDEHTFRLAITTVNVLLDDHSWIDR